MFCPRFRKNILIQKERIPLRGRRHKPRGVKEEREKKESGYLLLLNPFDSNSFPFYRIVTMSVEQIKDNWEYIDLKEFFTK